jgi:hypothetical protein
VYGKKSVVRTYETADCSVAMYDFGETAIDTEPGMVPDGAKCGVDKVHRHYMYT